jgi:hypothetical protein
MNKYEGKFDNICVTPEATNGNTKVTNEKSRHCDTEGNGGRIKGTYVELHSQNWSRLQFMYNGKYNVQCEILSSDGTDYEVYCHLGCVTM